MVLSTISDEDRSSFAFGRSPHRIRRSEVVNEDPKGLDRPEDQDCGLHPVDIFLTRLFDEIERKQPVAAMSPYEPGKAKDSYGRLLYAFTLLHKTSPKAYKQLINAVGLWDACKFREKKLLNIRMEAPLTWLFNVPQKQINPGY
ncbi:hypothetical protein D915_004257 [Fasciola hepatica]|uniref:Uncharacterized protein n=1 Tax=Fasciola hepatica TaxID=6192 RepID=A0A4E0RUQ4_FASHE|nr:hypothetical protein D915_004257 [Fasciola hepatica]